MKYDFRPVGVAAFLFAALAAAIFMILEDARSVYIAGAAQISTASAVSTASQLINGISEGEAEAGQDTPRDDPEEAVYEFLSEDGYTKKLWDEFFDIYPQYADEDGSGLREDYEMMFLPYFPGPYQLRSLRSRALGIPMEKCQIQKRSSAAGR